MAYDFTLFNRDNLNGSEEEITYKKKKKKNCKPTFQGWSWNQSKLIRHFGLVSIE